MTTTNHSLNEASEDYRLIVSGGSILRGPEGATAPNFQAGPPPVAAPVHTVKDVRRM